MANGNGSTTPAQQLEKVEAAIIAAGATAPSGTDLMSIVETAAALIDKMANGLGQCGEDDHRENAAFAEHLRSEIRAHVSRQVTKMEKRVADYKRLAGKLP
jgi:hypothetical protein